MAHEILLKLIVTGLKNLAEDNQMLCEYLNLRARAYGFTDLFKAADHVEPKPPYPPKSDSQLRAAELVDEIANNNALALISLAGRPSSPSPFIPKPDEADLLKLMVDWGLLQSGIQKSIILLYGLQPVPPPILTGSGPESESQLWAEIVAWFQKIASDTDLHTRVQKIASKSALAEVNKVTVPDADTNPLVRMEQGTHRVMLDLAAIAGRLPRHLYHAAHPAPPPDKQPAPSGSPASKGARRRN